MMHLGFDELLSLAEASASQEGFDEIQIEQLEHLKLCKDCYETFCLLSAMSDVMDESGAYAFRNRNVFLAKEAVQEFKTKVLARFRVIRNTAVNAVGAIMEQIDQETSFLKFAPSLAMATRGGMKTDSEAIRLEEFEDEKTYIVFEPDTNEIRMQLNVRNMEFEKLHVYIESDELPRIEFPITKRGNIVKGSIGNIPDGNFRIVMEAEAE